ncbi:hypothetical protein POM88_032485 [Heracleum sosnowskyi]|uniref:Importin subunit alpha n=1 Tax=Heracleum sosnowskyi TaxID=360622 RepID=A0AAD8MKL4_9APIA|nr:hypothetical protein POM88_032485 [Heracleum sosnowskyi]
MTSGYLLIALAHNLIPRGAMAESMSVDKKRDREEESMYTFQRMKRSHNVDTSFFRHYILSPTEMFYSADFHLNPPKINKFLKFKLRGRKKEISDHADEIRTLVNLEQWDEIEKHTEKLGDIFSIDPRLIGELDDDLLLLIIEFLSQEHKPKLQSQAVIILQHYVSYTQASNKHLVVQKITASIIANLINSKDRELVMQALCLFRTIAPTMPNHEFIPALDVVLETLFRIIHELDCGYDKEMSSSVSMTLAVVCQVYPMLPLPKLEAVVYDVDCLFQYSVQYGGVKLPTYACMTLVYLCEGRKGIDFSKIWLHHIVPPLIKNSRDYYEPKNRASTIAALAALGTIIRWGSDDDIEYIIASGTLPLLGNLLALPDKQYVGNACRIISNITAGNKKHIKAVINSGLIDDLFRVVQNYKLLDVKKEAAWAILNAMYGVGCDQIEAFRKSCIKPLRNILEVFRADQEIISFCLEGLVISKGVKVMHNGKPIDALELKKHLVKLRGGQFESELKKPQYNIDNKRFEDGVEFYVTHTVQESVRQPDLEIRLFYKSSEEDRSNMVDLMDVDEPEKNLYIMF